MNGTLVFDFLPGSALLLNGYRDGLAHYYNSIGAPGGASHAFARVMDAVMERQGRFVSVCWHPTAQQNLRVARWHSDGDSGTYDAWRVDVVFRHLDGGGFFRPDWQPLALRAEQPRMAPSGRVWREVGAFTEPRNPYEPWGGLTSQVVELRLAAAGAWRRANWLREHGHTTLWRADSDGLPVEAFPDSCPGGPPDYQEANLMAGVEALVESRRSGRHRTVSVKWMPPPGEWRMA